ncbi:MAG: 50S ribosomal protein L6 [Ignavibacteria bacterium]|nr:50S ribosomal protein L6 [Ignavibacteria bacterium]MBI3766227.1 50S ribosomal protein L6 [Ignavibacteriales bacterium]
MSRIGRKPIPSIKGVKVEKKDGTLKVSGPKGELTARIPASIGIDLKENEILLTRSSDLKSQKALHGTWRALVHNMLKGVSEGFQKRLEIVGVGYKAELKGKKVQLALGYSHPILFEPPAGIKVEIPAPTNIVISGIDKQLVGQVAAKLRSFRPPEPYKGKGVKYEGEYIRRKAGKAAATAGAKAG